MKVFLRQQAGELAHARAAIRLSDEEVHTISSLRTAKRDYALAYVINGTRGRGTVQIKVGPREYWTATSDPDRDEPLRQHALRESRRRRLAGAGAARRTPPGTDGSPRGRGARR